MECDSAHFWPSLSPLAILGSLPFFLPSAEFVSPLLPLLPILPRLPRLPAASRSFHPLLPLLTTHFYQTLSNLLAAQKSYTLKKKRHTKTLLIKNAKVWKFMWKRVDLWNIMCHNVQCACTLIMKAVWPENWTNNTLPPCVNLPLIGNSGEYCLTMGFLFWEDRHLWSLDQLVLSSAVS